MSRKSDDHFVAFAMATGVCILDDDRYCEKSMRRQRYERKKSRRERGDS